ncbi:MAG: cytochrome c [Dongiaceae bacterium]
MKNTASVAAARRGAGIGARQNSGGGRSGQWGAGRRFLLLLPALLLPALLLTALLLPAFLLTAPPVLAQDDDADAVGRGAYLFAAAGCAGCHTDVENDGPPLAGGRALETPFGIFYSPNITPDPDTGIGDWTEADFLRALRDGKAPDGSTYFPVFPYTSFTLMADADIADMWAYLRSVDPVSRENRAHEAAFPFGWRGLLPIWQWLHLEPGPMAPDQGAAIARGAYLVNALGHCGECHTPRGAMGALDRDRWLAGTDEGPEGGKIPNITPDPETGIGAWSDDEILRVLESGMLPDFDVVGGGMAEVVRNSTSKLTDEDRVAIVAYLRSLPAIGNEDAAATQPEY